MEPPRRTSVYSVPAPTLWRWLTRSVELGWAKVEGSGKKNDPFRYWLPVMEEKWKTDPEHKRYQDSRWLHEEIRKAMAQAPRVPGACA